MLQSEYGLQPLHLENYTDGIQATPEGENNPMAYNRVRVFIGTDSKGQPIYTQISGSNQNEINDRIVKAYVRCGRIFEFLPDSFLPLTPAQSPIQPVKHGFKDCAEHWFTVFGKPNIEASTALTYRRQLDIYWIPAFEDKTIEDIKAADVESLMKVPSMDRRSAEHVYEFFRSLADN